MPESFRVVFGRDPDRIASAPGRVNLMGEHTDYNGGAVLPTLIPQRTRVALGRRTDGQVVVSTTFTNVRACWRLGEEQRRSDCFDYVQACTWVLAQTGIAVPGCDVAITSSIPAGSGLASSAALVVALLRGFRDLVGFDLDDLALACLAHRAESEFVGARVGIMDQMAVSLADEAAALYLDTRTLSSERIALPVGVEIAVIDSGVRHALVAGDYATRRDECERAAVALGVPDLCRLGRDALGRIARLPPPLDRRARHVVTEHARVADAVRAMRADDVEELGRIFSASHASQRDDYAVSVPQVDSLVALAEADPDVLGARLTGGGFGGAIVVLARRGRAREVAARVVRAHGAGAAPVASVVVPVTT